LGRAQVHKTEAPEDCVLIELCGSDCLQI
jgi:hypothetical protein